MRKSITESLWNWIKAIVVAFGMALIVRYFLLIPVQVEGDSMAPALQPGDYILYHPISSIDRFDIILFHDENGVAYIKRVVGMPGETVVYLNDQLFIDGQQISEPFLSKKSESNQVFTADYSIIEATDVQEVPEHHYFVLGDNRPRSKDSRMFGFVPQEAIEGKARLIIYPFDQFTWIQ